MTERETPGLSILTPEPTAVKFKLQSSTFANQRTRGNLIVD